MKLLQFQTLLISLKFGRLEGACPQHTGWVRSLVALGWMTCTLLSPSYAQEQVGQRVNAASGQQVFNNACRTCHTTKEGENRLGPHLYKIIGRKTGSLPDYDYSSALKSADFVWDEEKLQRFIANPDELVPGNRMKPYSGLAIHRRQSKNSFFPAIGRVWPIAPPGAPFRCATGHEAPRRSRWSDAFSHSRLQGDEKAST